MPPGPATVMLLGALVCLLAAVLNAIADPKVTPSFQSLTHPGVAVVSCVFEQPLNDCLVRVSDQTTFRDFDFVLDLNRGSRSDSTVIRSSGGEVRGTASYAGAGLEAGHCGVALNVESGHLVILVECLGRSIDGDWHRGVSLLTTTHDPILPSNTSTARLIVAGPGSDLAVHMTSRGALRECYVTSPGAGKGVFSPGFTPLSESRYRVHGRGASAGECGGKLTNVQLWDSGVWYWRAYQGSEAAWQATVVLVSAAPSGDPVLHLPDPSTLHVNALLNATCIAPPSIPPSKLTWLLDGRLIRRDDGNETLSFDVATSMPWDAQPAVQTLSYRMTTPDFGKRLECRAVHQTGTRSAGHVLPKNRASPSPIKPNRIVTKPSAPPPINQASNPTQPKQNVPSTNVLALDVPKPTTTSPNKNGCPALATSSVTVSCLLAGAKVDCGRVPSPLGTLARIACREGYKAQENHPGALNSSCTKRGWRPRPIGCFLDCGRRRGGANPLVVGGDGAKQSEFPWHVAVFRMQQTSYQPICGGSLITPRSFVSAAHCFWDETTGKPQNASLYKSSVGKHTLAWSTQDESEQRRSIRAVYIPAHFAGNAKRLESDIALVEFAAPVLVTPAVSTVCVDWKTTFQYQQLTADSLGTVPGWGITETNTMSPTLRLVDLPFVPFIECRDSVPWDFKNYLTIDKFCGGYRNRSVGVCQGDSGGGFVFPAQKLAHVRYYLRGVVSSAPFRGGAGDRVCQAEHRSAFTMVFFVATAGHSYPHSPHVHLDVDHGRVMHLFAPNEDCLLRACKDIGISAKQLHQDVRSIKEWMAQQPHLPAVKESLLVENLLLRCKGSVQATKKAIDYHLSMRAAAPEFFADRDPLGEEIQCVARHWTNATLHQLTSEGYRARISVFATKENLELSTDSSLVKMTLMQTDLALKEDVSLGEVFIFDIHNLTASHVRRLTPSLLHKCYKYWLHGYKARVKGFHFLFAPPVAHTLLSFLKTFLLKRLAARVHLHPDLESLHKLVDRRILPKDYGGDQKPLTEEAYDWQKKMETYRDWFLKEDSWKVDESRRPLNSVNSRRDLYGFEGTFKKLEID